MSTTTPTYTFTDDARNTAANALRVAARRFDEDAEQMRAIGRESQPANPGYESLARQFEKQARDARHLADIIHNDEPDASPWPGLIRRDAGLSACGDPECSTCYRLAGVTP